MFAARDQENLIHAHQTVAAAKPLNQSVRGLAPKTPGNHGGKATLNAKSAFQNKGNNAENATYGGKKGTGAEKPALLTPAPRDRAPLGAKTTNAKAHAYQTPGPLTGGQGLKTQKRTSARKPKLKVHHQVDPGQVLDVEDADDEPEIEYCPPKITELPDYPSDEEFYIQEGQKFPQPDTRNLVQEWLQHAANQKGADGLTSWERRQKQLAEEDARGLEELFAATRKAQQKNEDDVFAELDEPKKTTHKSSSSSSGPSTIKSRAAVNSLSHSSRPGFAAPTSSMQAKTRPAVDGRATMGYAKGRRIASTLRDHTAASTKVPSRNPVQKKTGSSGATILADAFKPLEDDEDEAVFDLQSKPAWMVESDDEEVFQLPMPKP